MAVLRPHVQNSDAFLKRKEIYLIIVGWVMPFFLSFEHVNKKRGDETVDLTNIPCERVSGVLKYEYWNTSFGSIRISSGYWSGLTWAKQLRSIGYWERDEIGTSWSASQSSTRRVHDVVLDSLSLLIVINLIFLINCGLIVD